MYRCTRRNWSPPRTSLVRAETGLLNFYRQLAFQQHSFSDPAGNLFHKFDPANHRPGDERHVADMLLSVAWRDARPEIDRVSRYESPPARDKPNPIHPQASTRAARLYRTNPNWI